MEDRMCSAADDKVYEVDMTVDKMIDIFSSFPSYTDCHVQLLRIKTDKNNQTIYTGREISLHPSGAVKSLVSLLGQSAQRARQKTTCYTRGRRL